MFKFQFRCRATILSLVTAALLAGNAAHSLAADYATILMYHRFGEDRYPSTNVTLEQFEEHLEILASGPYNVMPLDEVVEHLQTGEPLPDRSVAITIDDAYLSVFTEAFPRLKERRKSQAGYTSGGEQQMCAIGRALMSRPETVLLDEPSMGLAPQLVEEIFGIVKALNEKEGVSFLLAEQNTNVALRFAHYGYILESGRVVMDGPAAELRENPDVKEFYLGMSDEGRKSFRDVRSYRRRKRWLS